MRGYFGIGVEGISKSANVGALYRTTNAFGGSFVFAVGSPLKMRDLKNVDTSGTAKNLPLYEFESAEEMLLPKGCALVGVEITDDAIDLPSFHHPRMAAYVMGPERSSLRRDGGPLRPHREDPHQIRDQRRPRRCAGHVRPRPLHVPLRPPPHKTRRPHRTRPVPEFGRPLWVRKDRKRAAAGK